MFLYQYTYQKTYFLVDLFHNVESIVSQGMTEIFLGLVIMSYQKYYPDPKEDWAWGNTMDQIILQIRNTR